MISLRSAAKRLAELLRGQENRAPQEDAATDFWNQKYASAAKLEKAYTEDDSIDYTKHPFLYRLSVSQPLTGDPDKWWLEDIATTYLRPAAARLLALGCGFGVAEEFLVQHGFAEHLVAYELSQEAVNATRDRLREAPYAGQFELRCGDALDADLETGSFDCLFVGAAIHHFDRIEEMFQLMHRVLKPGGLLIFDEYVGPDHHQYPPDLVEIMDGINACLDPQYRVHCNGNLRESVPACSLEYILEHDPSEGVHSSQILPLTYQYFEVIDRRDFGGTIMRPFFSCILQNFDFNDPKDQTVARLIIFLEQELTRRGILPHHHTVVIARPRAVPRPPLSPAETERISYTGWSPPEDDQHQKTDPT
jgi:SAM-dependent methyltransferase